MTAPVEGPLLFLDVDGTLLPYDGAQLPSTPEEWCLWQSMSNPQLAKLDLTHGPRLLAMPCVLMWATAWMEDANEVIGPLLGLPMLPVVDLPDAQEQDEVGVLHWKTRAIVKAASGRPFIWVDDEISHIDRAWVSTHHRGQAHLHQVKSRVGLTDADFAALDDWLREASSSWESHRLDALPGGHTPTGVSGEGRSRTSGP
jgi:hypothetical protein